MDLLTVKNESMVNIPDAIPGITNPEGERPPADAVSLGNASMAASQEASPTPGKIGIMAGGEQAKNLVFILVVGFLFYKYGKGLLNA